MVQDGSTFQNGQRCLKHWKKYMMQTYGLSAEGAKAGGKTILPISMVQSFFCVLFFSLCSNLSMWPGGQIVPDESRCYIPIFDGLVSSDRSSCSPLVHCTIGPLVHWFIVPLVHWSIGPLYHWSIGPLVRWSS